MTQEDLAAAAGLSTRVVAKAEAGGGLSATTLQALADCLSLPDEPVHAEDLAFDPLEIAAEFFRHYADHEAEMVDQCRPFLDPNMTAFVAGEVGSNPIAGTYEGLTGFEHFVRTFFHYFERPDKVMFREPDLVLEGKVVTAWGYERLNLRGMPPLPPPGGLLLIKLFFDCGKIVRFEDYYDVIGVSERLVQQMEEYKRLQCEYEQME